MLVLTFSASVSFSSTVEDNDTEDLQPTVGQTGVQSGNVISSNSQPFIIEIDLARLYGFTHGCGGVMGNVSLFPETTSVIALAGRLVTWNLGRNGTRSSDCPPLTASCFPRVSLLVEIAAAAASNCGGREREVFFFSLVWSS